ncbi:UDP-N-acetylmuramoyl-L-alanyl-D-glutamate--2,6-diaminopimelate ligase [Oceanobacillus sp. J11TS1]|uniref:UDP-N-acetylmuramoyl-L-alanyl-D-glutamate--2, 6-diaminopimelate ligase n=1 Tax=Oceanobacillus sp. J11TS1 TaxID=2807191 RepID=UPI001B2E17C0|nr:UDP-N-acetylmuramoyl-L-alanyl-D-glutamate--2,6-diaminopimelate ligase [Oceanobacillus sp. J11TS1]GIO21873.1 UDP-N-acetylmuramoyl-L-alanyl-D-glutamate--2,6-diaminopimelate ligase [Oceanobacillus sp. J11TS1]
MELTKLLDGIGFYQTTELIQGIEVENVEMDSRKVKPGSLFVCIEGYTVDGHDYLEQAIKNGAVAAVVCKDVQIDSNIPLIQVKDTGRALAMLTATYYDYPTTKFPLIGVTGTNGKTTTTYLLDTIFEKQQKKSGVIGSIQVKIGDETFPVINTTPDALALNRIFHQMQEKEVDQVIMEVSSHALDMGRVFGCDYDIAIFTNLSQDHLDYHKDMDDYLRAKSLLFSGLGNDYHPDKKKYAIINEDDSSSDLLKRSTAQQVLTYSCKQDADIRANNIVLSPAGVAFDLVTPIGTTHIKTHLIGMFNVYNMLAAAGAAIASGVKLEVIKEALEDIKGVDGRFEPINEGQDFSVIVDFAHTPDSLENVLQTSREFAKRKVYVVIGCGGDRDRKKRPLMADVAVKYADHALFTSDNPRTEDPVQILQDMTGHLADNEATYEVIVDRTEAIKHAVQLAQKDDIILIAGKGHETYQVIGKTKYDFDDRQIAREAIREKGE